MRILLIGNYYYPEHTGGVETVSFNLVKQYRRAGHAVRWVAADVPPKFRTLQEGDVPIRAWNITEERLGFPHPIPFPEVFGKLYQAIAWCDVIHLQDCLYSINILAFAFAKALRKPVLITQYAKIIPYAQPLKRLLQSAAYATFGRWMFRTAERLVFITSNVREGMQHINPGKHYQVVPLGVDTDFFQLLSEQERRAVRCKYVSDTSKPLILFVGRMVERKGVGLFRELIPAHPEWNWVMIGRPDDYDPSTWSYPNLAFRPRLQEDDLRDLLASADLLLHPSKGEGFTLTASESMAAGTPVVISKESLFEVEQTDSPLFEAVDLDTASIEIGIKALLAMSPPDASRRRQQCRQFAEGRYSWKNVSAQYLDLLREITTRKR